MYLSSTIPFFEREQMLLFIYLQVWQYIFFVPTRNITFLFYPTLASPISVYPSSINGYYLLSTTLINFLCTSHQQNCVFCTHRCNFMFTYKLDNSTFWEHHSQYCILLIYLTLANPISVYPCNTTPFIFVENLHLLKTLTDNHQGKYQSEEPQRCSWTNLSKLTSGWQTPYCW